MTFVLKLMKRLIEVALVIFIISLFMKNKNVEFQIDYYGLAAPIKVAFWELVTFCVALGIIVAALGDFITQIRWIGERRRMIKTDRDHKSVTDKLNAKIQSLESENRQLKSELEQKNRELAAAREREPELPATPAAREPEKT
jgi:type III secretory pathway component EscU